MKESEKCPCEAVVGGEFCKGENEEKVKRKLQQKHVRCPECGRRLLTKVLSCGDAGCLHVVIPPHKKKGWWKKPKERRKCL